ncbi:MAG: CopG family ribbon-helix-helix protein [Bradymonadia bacterium]
MKLISMRLPHDLMKKVDRIARKRKQSRSEFIRQALENALMVERAPETVGLTDVRDELLLAVGQLGDSLRQLPKFIKQETSERKGEEHASHSSTREGPAPAFEGPSKRVQEDQSDRFSTDLEDEISPIELMAVEESNASVPAHELGRTQTAEGSPMEDIFLGWSTHRDLPAELTLRPREETFDYEPDAVETLKPSKPIVQEAPKPEVATFEGWVGETDRRRGQTRGRPIGEERRQSIRLARVLAYKDWDAQRLATRLKMPIEMIENAIEGREDLASLKVEALLSTWEEEMQHVGWKPDG